MKPFGKIIVAAALSLTLLTVPSMFGRETGRECYAQGYPTIDIQNLLMNILDMVQQEMGIMEDLDQYAEKFENLKKAIQVAKQITQGVKFGLSVYQMSQDVVQMGNRLYDCWSYFQTKAFTQEAAVAAGLVPVMFAQVAGDIVEIITDKIKEYQDMSGYGSNGGGKAMASSTMQIMQLVEEGVREARAEFIAVSHECERRLSILYRYDNAVRMAAANDSFRGMLVY